MYIRDGLLASEGGCVFGGVGVSLVGGEGGDSNTGSKALPGTGFHTPSDSKPIHTLMIIIIIILCEYIIIKMK